MYAYEWVGWETLLQSVSITGSAGLAKDCAYHVCGQLYRLYVFSACILCAHHIPSSPAPQCQATALHAPVATVGDQAPEGEITLARHVSLCTQCIMAVYLWLSMYQ